MSQNVTPLSVMIIIEFERWTLAFKIVSLAGNTDERVEIIANVLIPQDFEGALPTRCVLLKNPSSKRHIVSKMWIQFFLKSFTPLLHMVDSSLSKELFSLLNFICPEMFVNYKNLDSFLHRFLKHGRGGREE